MKQYIVIHKPTGTIALVTETLLYSEWEFADGSRYIGATVGGRSSFEYVCEL